MVSWSERPWLQALSLHKYDMLLHITCLNIMLLFVIVALFVVSLRVHSKYSPGVSCQFQEKPY